MVATPSLHLYYMSRVIPDDYIVCVIGDPHRAYEYEKAAREIRKRVKDSTPIVILGVGDSGFGFHSRKVRYRLDNVNKALEEENAWVLTIRGNHDRRIFFDGKDQGRIRLLPDYYSFSYRGRSILMVGGAVSIDRKENINVQDLDYDTLLKMNDTELYDPYEGTLPCPQGLGQYDVVISHDCPKAFFDNFGTEFTSFNGDAWFKNDAKLMQDMDDNRAILQDVRLRAKPKEWFFGHYHRAFTHRDGDTMFRCLEPSAIYSLNYQ